MFKFLKKLLNKKQEKFEVFIKKNPYYLQDLLVNKKPEVKEEPDPVPAVVLTHTILSTNGVAEDFSHALVDDFANVGHEVWTDKGTEKNNRGEKKWSIY